MENASLEGQTEHQVLQIEETSADGRVLQQGMVDVWKDGDGKRYMRRLYDMHHRMMAEKWRNQAGDSGARGSPPMNGLWDRDLSAQGFAALGDGPPQVRHVATGYELSRVGPTLAQPQLISATLVLDRHLQPVRQTIRVREGAEIRELHFVQANYERSLPHRCPIPCSTPRRSAILQMGRATSFRETAWSGGADELITCSWPNCRLLFCTSSMS